MWLNDYERVSRQHARFDFDGQKLTVHDQNSTNGVLVNGRKVEQATLKNGDLIDLGDFSATVLLEGTSPTNSPLNTVSQKWRALPGTPLQKWAALAGALTVLFLGSVGMRRRSEPDPFSSQPGAHAPKGNAGASEIPDASPAPPQQNQTVAPGEPSNGRISPASVQNVKAATVLIGHRSSGGYAMGSGFALGDSRRIVTNRHVVVDENGQIQDCTLIFEAGTPRQRKVTIPASNISLAPDEGNKEDFQDDLAVITLDAGQTPALPLGQSEDLSETDEVYAVGFPLGTQTLTLNGDLPSVSIKPARVERLQRDKDSTVKVIQLGSSVTHGNSGGPVVNNRGEVVGVISSGVEGTGMAYAIPMVFVRTLP